MDDKHTPGPWAATTIPHSREILRPAGREILIGSDDWWVCAMYPGIGADDEATDAANARLIAAAPRLLKELRAIVALAEVGEDGRQLMAVPTTHPAFDAARAAINLATTGEES